MDEATAVPTLATRSGPSDLWQGFALPFRGFATVRSRSPKVRSLSRLCSMVTVVVLIAVAVVLARSTDDLLGLLWAKPEGILLAVVWWLLYASFVLVLYAVGAVTMPLLVLAPLQDPLSEATEQACGEGAQSAVDVATMLRTTLSGLWHTFARVTVFMLGNAVLFALHLVPGVGSIAWTFLGTAWTIVWGAGEYLGAPMARHLYSFRTVASTVRARPWACLGFGIAVWLLLWIPVVNFFLVPRATVGGTLLFLALRRAGVVTRTQRA